MGGPPLFSRDFERGRGADRQGGMVATAAARLGHVARLRTVGGRLAGKGGGD